MKFIKKEEFKDSKWSAGVTTEVFIYPEDASVGEKTLTLGFQQQLVMTKNQSTHLTQAFIGTSHQLTM